MKYQFMCQSDFMGSGVFPDLACSGGNVERGVWKCWCLKAVEGLVCAAPLENQQQNSEASEGEKELKYTLKDIQECQLEISLLTKAGIILF